MIFIIIDIFGCHCIIIWSCMIIIIDMIYTELYELYSPGMSSTIAAQLAVDQRTNNNPPRLQKQLSRQNYIHIQYLQYTAP